MVDDAPQASPRPLVSGTALEVLGPSGFVVLNQQEISDRDNPMRLHGRPFMQSRVHLPGQSPDVAPLNPRRGKQRGLVLRTFVNSSRRLSTTTQQRLQIGTIRSRTTHHEAARGKSFRTCDRRIFWVPGGPNFDGPCARDAFDPASGSTPDQSNNVQALVRRRPWARAAWQASGLMHCCGNEGARAPLLQQRRGRRAEIMVLVNPP